MADPIDQYIADIGSNAVSTTDALRRLQSGVMTQSTMGAETGQMGGATEMLRQNADENNASSLGIFDSLGQFGLNTIVVIAGGILFGLGAYQLANSQARDVVQTVVYGRNRR